MRLNRLYLMFVVLVAVAFAGCKKDDPNGNSFTNRLYIETENKVSTLVIKPSTLSASKVIRASVAKPAQQKIDIVYEIDPNMVDLYNKIYYDDALMLPEENYELVETSAIIPVGGVTSTDINLNLKQLDLLDRKLVYVLPVTIKSATNIEMLASARTVYYLFKAGAVINVVANIRENFLAVKWAKPAVVNNLTKITMEALVRAHSFDHPTTIMGIEGLFLMRIGDSGYPSEGFQIANAVDNFPRADKSPLIPTEKWTQISVTMDVKYGDYVIYLDGEIAAEGVGPKIGSVSLGQDGVVGNDYTGFFIGVSYEKTRWFDGEIAECRIWNVIRTQEQIAANRYEVDPASEGLVAYWKFDEGAGVMVSDRTSNGNHATAPAPLKWIKLTLPE